MIRRALPWLLLAAMVYALALLLAGCFNRPELPSVPPAEASPTGTATVPAVGDSDLPTLRARLASAQAAVTAAEANGKAQAREQAERPLRALLTWAQWAGGALALLGVLALGLSLSPWASWIPGGRATAVAAIATGAGTIFLARSLAAALDLAWLPWVLLAIGVLGAVAWIAWLAIRETAAHADRVAPATTDDDRRAAGQQSAAAQARAGVRGLINLIRPRGRA